MREILFKISNTLGIRHPDDESIFFTTRRAVLYSRILAVTGLAVLFTAIKDFIDQGFAPIPLLVLLLFSLIAFSFLLNKLERYTASRVVYLLVMNTVICLLCSVIPSERLAFVYFFPLIIIAFVIFDDREINYRNFFVGLSLAFLLLLVFTDFKLFWNYQLSVSGLGQKNMVINIVFTVLIISICIDFLIRTNKRAEATLMSQAEFIQQKNEELKKINAELDRFVYSASHDLRAPLLSIQGLSKIAIAEATNENEKKYFSLIYDRIVKLDDFIRDIIEYSRNTRTENKFEVFNPEPVIHEIIENLKYLQGADQISVSIECSVSEMYSDKNRIKVILSNIVANAIKYHNIRQDDPKISIEVKGDNNSAIITIADNGIGIADDAKARIFEMFYRASERSSGSGLGLYIVKEIVEKLKGNIQVESTLGRGTTFIINLPTQL